MSQHPLHLLIDLIGRRAARLLVFGSLALRRAQFVSVPAPQRLAALRSAAVAQGGGGCGHLAGGTREFHGSGEGPEEDVDWSKLRAYLEDGDYVIAVPLLGDVTEAGGDVDAPADVHVHFHGLLLDLTVQI